MIDVDHFKLYNDNYGHLEGDECLRRLGKALSSMITGDADFAARYGGEEFALLHPQSTSEGAATLAERMREAVAAARFTTPAGPLRITISLGVAEYTRHMSSPKDLLAAASQVQPSTKEWFATARNYATFANQGGQYDDILKYLRK